MPPTAELPQGAARVRMDVPAVADEATDLSEWAVPVGIGCFTLVLAVGAIIAGIAVGLG